MSDERPKKSWRELDRARESGGSRSRRDPDARQRERTEASSAYKQYKTQLDKLFTPGLQAQVPESLRAKLGPATDEGRDRADKTRALHEVSDEAALAAYLGAGYALPEDGRLLVKLLDVQKAELLLPVLHALMAVVSGGQKPSRMLLIQKLDAIALRAPGTELATLAADIRAELG
jgi:hypothetical protein